MSRQKSAKKAKTQDSQSDEAIQALMLRVFAYAQALVAKELLSLLKPKLSGVELEYVSTLGPKIEAQYLDASIRLEHGGCSEGRESNSKAQKMESEAKEQFDNVGVSQGRQKLLENLVHAAHLGWACHCPPKKDQEIEHWLRKGFGAENIAQFLELAETLEERPMYITDFLRKTLECAKSLSSSSAADK